MNPSPLPQPAPFTCPNCGLGLEITPDFCPRCGASLTERKKRAVPLWTGVALAFGLTVFGAIGACGGLFSITSLSSGTEDHMRGVLLFVSLPFVFIGLIGFILCLLPFFRRPR